MNDKALKLLADYCKKHNIRLNVEIKDDHLIVQFNGAEKITL